jgi:hypothetical protein
VYGHGYGNIERAIRREIDRFVFCFIFMYIYLISPFYCLSDYETENSSGSDDESTESEQNNVQSNNKSVVAVFLLSFLSMNFIISLI